MEMETTKKEREWKRADLFKIWNGAPVEEWPTLLRLLDDFATLEAELSNARKALKEIGAYGNAAARLWLETHPEPEAGKQ